MKLVKNSLKLIFIFLILVFPNFQINTAKASSTPMPPPRKGHSMVYCSQSNEIFLFGGSKNNTETGILGDTWIFDCDTQKWQEISLEVTPGLSTHHTMTYDALNNRVILLTSNKETWIFKMGTLTWSKLNLTNLPPRRLDAGFTFDSNRSQAILFGGFQPNGKLGDLWTFNCNNDSWIEIKQTGIKPSNRYGPSFLYNANLDQAYLVGGRPFTSEFCDIWILNLNNYSWQELSIDSKKPSKRYWMDAEMDQKNNKIVFFSGSGNFPNLEETTWVFNCKTESWSELKRLNKPKMRMTQQMVYNEKSKKMFMFGGGNPENLNVPFGDQWHFNTNLKMWREVKKVNLPFLLITLGMIGSIFTSMLFIYKKRMK